MDEAQVTALITKLLGEGLAPVTKALQGFEALRETVATQGKTLTQVLEVTTAPVVPETPETPATPDPLIGTVTKLQAQLDTMVSDRAKAEYGTQLETLLDGFDHRSRNVSRTQIAAMFPEAKKTDAGYVLDDGTLLKDAVGTYFATDDGKVLLKGKRTVQGTSVEEGERVVSPAAPGALDLSSLSF